MHVVVEVGPAAIRRIDGDRRPAPPAVAQAVLGGIDDPVVLHDDRPADPVRLLRMALTAAIGPEAAEATVVHPSWWPRSRIDRVLAAAPVPARPLTRAAWIRRHTAPGAVVVEAGPVVAVSTADTVRVRHRPHPDWILEAVGDAGEVVLDDPQRTSAAADLRAALGRHGIAVVDVDLRAIGAERPPPRAPRTLARAVGAVTAGLVVTAVVSIGLNQVGREPEPVVVAESLSLVEGRVAVRVPAGWPVRRVTRGPGSARVEVSAPDGAAALHITQAHTPGTTLGATAAALTRAAAALPADVFTPVTATDVAGRAVLTYRETRPGRTIRWSVLLDGATRIAVGCQSAVADDRAVRAACAEAISSAREVVGTDPGRPSSN